MKFLAFGLCMAILWVLLLIQIDDGAMSNCLTHHTQEYCVTELN